jgi:hypothetical protein
MGNKPDWVGQSFKKGEILKLADGTESLPDLGGDDSNFDPGFDVNYIAMGNDSSNFGGGGRIGRNVYRGEEGTLNLGLSGSHWRGGGRSGADLQGVDATYSTRDGDFGIKVEPQLKSVKLTYRKEF